MRSQEKMRDRKKMVRIVLSNTAEPKQICGGTLYINSKLGIIKLPYLLRNLPHVLSLETICVWHQTASFQPQLVSLSTGAINGLCPPLLLLSDPC